MKRELSVAKPFFPDKPKILEGLGRILESGRLMNGPFGQAFEAEFARVMNASHAAAVNSCTTALEIVLRYINVADGEVIVPTNTFLASPNAVLFAGGKPVLADIKANTYFLDPQEVLKRITSKTKAVIAVHIAGIVPREIEEIREICRQKHLFLIEDCAHAVGAAYNGKMAGTFGFAGCFSFYPTKIMTTGSGGMILTEDPGLIRFAQSVRVHGAGAGLTDIVHVGNDWFLDEMRCCMGMNQLEHLGEFLRRRRRVAACYDELLRKTDLIVKLPLDPLSEHAYYKYPVQVNADIDVPDVKRIFPEKYGFELESVYWPTCHLQPVYRKRFGFAEGDFPVAESVMSKQVTLPLHIDISDEDAAYAVDCLIAEIEARSRA